MTANAIHLVGGGPLDGETMYSLVDLPQQVVVERMETPPVSYYEQDEQPSVIARHYYNYTGRRVNGAWIAVYWGVRW